MNALMMIQFFVMIGFYLVAGILLIVLMVKGINALSAYTKKTNMEIEKLQQDKCVESKSCCEGKAKTEEVVTEEATEEVTEEVAE